MIENFNASKNPSNTEFVDIKKYIGVASINILAVNPNNEKLRKYGWTMPEDADEPKYVTTIERDGKQIKSARVTFLVQIQDMEDKPVILLNFWCRPDIVVNRDSSKCKIIDAFGRTAWATKGDVSAMKIPQYSNGLANISTPYKTCHSGEDELIQFLFKYLNITPLQIFDRSRQSWIDSKNPGRLTIDNWSKICDGDVQEIERYVALQPENCVKVILGVKNTDDNKTYQTFLNTGYIGNGASPDKNTGEYATARKLINRYNEGHADSAYSFSAFPVKEWTTSATEVKDNSQTMFDENGNYTLEEDDLPFA